MRTLTAYLLGFLLLISTGVLAQGGPPGDGGPTPDPPTAVPIDGGASLLLAAGAALGVRRLRRRNPKA